MPPPSADQKRPGISRSASGNVAGARFDGTRMARTPVTVGLTLCDYVIVEAMTHKISLVGCLTEIAVDELPGLAEPFSAVAFLTGAQGTIDLDLVVEEWDS